MPKYFQYDPTSKNLKRLSFDKITDGKEIVDYFHKNDESYIIAENIQLTKARYIQLFGETLSEYIFKFHSCFNQLKLTDYELVLFYTFILSSVNTNIVKDKICLLQMKAKYTRAIIYEFELSKKNAYFYQQFSEVNFKFKVNN